MRRGELSTCQPDAQADYEESLCISQTVESSILTALWGGKEGKGERRMCCDAGAEAVLKITVHTYISHPRPRYLLRLPGLQCSSCTSDHGRAEGGPLVAHQQERMDVLAARNQTSVRNQLEGDWLQPEVGVEWPHLSHPLARSSCQPPLPLDSSYSAVTAASSHLQQPTSPVSA